MIRQPLLFAATTALAVGLVSPAFAGEVTGSGKQTPIGTYVVMAAICAFSGLEDHPHEPGNTQTPHEAGGVINPAGVASICQFVNPGKNPKTPPPPPE